MKVGLSFSRCVRDIVENKVQLHEVLIIIARTNFDPNVDDQWSNIWKNYCERSFLTNPEWANYDLDNLEHENKFRQVSLELYNNGQIHQPRKFGAPVKRLPYHWLDLVLPIEEMDENPAIKKAWEQYKIIAGLTANKKTFFDDF